MIKQKPNGSVVFSNIHTVVSRTREKLARQKRRKRRRELTSIETNKVQIGRSFWLRDFQDFLNLCTTKWPAKLGPEVNFQELLPSLFINCTINGDQFVMFEELAKTLQFFNVSKLHQKELKYLARVLRRSQRQPVDKVCSWKTGGYGHPDTFRLQWSSALRRWMTTLNKKHGWTWKWDML